MDLFTEHWEYIIATASAKAVEIGQQLHRAADIEDYTQDLILYLAERQDKYNADRSAPKTFIAMILKYGKRDILRKLYQLKRRTYIKSTTFVISLHDQIDDNRRSEQRQMIAEYILTLPDPVARMICRMILLHGMHLRTIEKLTRLSPDEIRNEIKKNMKGLKEWNG